MNFLSFIATAFEAALVILVIWGIFNEDRLVAFEERLVARFRRRKFSVKRGGEFKGNPVCRARY